MRTNARRKQALPNNMLWHIATMADPLTKWRMAHASKALRARTLTPNLTQKVQAIKKLIHIFHEAARATIRVANAFRTGTAAANGLRKWEHARPIHRFTRTMDVTPDGQVTALLSTRPVGQPNVRNIQQARGSVDIVTDWGKDFTLDIEFQQNQTGKGGTLVLMPRYPRGAAEWATLAHEALSLPKLTQKLEWRRFKSEWFKTGVTVEFE